MHSRRKFLSGSVGVAALGALGKLAPAPVWETPEALMTLEDYSKRILAPYIEGLSQRVQHTIYYGTDEVPREFNGFVPFVDAPNA